MLTAPDFVTDNERQYILNIAPGEGNRPISILRACSYGQKLSRFPRKHFDRSNNVVCSYGEMFSRLPGKVSRGDVDFVKCKQKVFPLSGKVVFIWDKNYLGHRDLACHQARSRLTGKLFVSYERKVTFHTIFVRRRDLACKLVEMFSR